MTKIFKTSSRGNLDQQQTSKDLMNESKRDGIDIVFENIRYSVDVPDDSVKSSNPFKKPTKKK